MARLVNCNDGTQEIVCDMPTENEDGTITPCPDVIPCENHGGVKIEGDSPTTNPSKPLFTETQKKWISVVGLSVLAYYILYKAGTFSK